ncbi:MAG: PspC domain-containing protein [Ferruginibacter sp.]
MKQVININFQGRVVPIEVTAFDILKEYTGSLNRHFANEEGKEEIINDIESRIGELFQERLKNGSTCITEEDVNAIINSMGRPEDFETEENSQPAGDNTQQTGSAQSSYYNNSGPKRLYRDEEHKILGGVCAGLANYFNIDPVIVRIIFIVAFGLAFLPYLILWMAVPGSAASVIGGTRKKLYRDGEDKLIAGVCSGIGNYFGVSAWIPRALFLLPFLTFIFRWGHWGYWDFPSFLRIGFSPTAFIVYIILWLVIPEASTTAEKLEMKGEKVDIDSIKNSVMEEMKAVQQRVHKFGKEAAGMAADKSKAFAAEATAATRRTSRSFGDVLVVIMKMFAYFIIGSVGLALVVALFAAGIAAVGIFPLKNFLIGGDWENAYAWGTLIFFIAVPIIGILTWIIRKLTRSKANSKTLTLTFTSLWILGWVCFIMLISSISHEFRYSNKNLAETEIALNNPKVNKLEITSVTQIEKFTRNRWLNFSPFEDVDDDTAYVKNYDVKILKAPNDSFRVTMIKMASGSSRAIAERNAAAIGFSGVQKDTVLLLDKGIAINKTDKFRNQHLVILIYVPVGKHIMIDRSVAWYNDNIHFGTSWDDNSWNYDFNGEAHDWSANVEYEMRADGKLYNMNGVPAGQHTPSRFEKNSTRVTVTSGDGDDYRYDNTTAPLNKVDSLKQKLEKEKQKLRDSLEKAKDKIDKQLEKMDNTEAPDPVTYYHMPGSDAVMTTIN